MPTLPTDPGSPLLVFADESGAPGAWLRPGGEGRGHAGDGFPEASRTVLAVPGHEVAIHWLELDHDLTLAQAAAAARLLLADASAEPLADLHLAVGRPEKGLTPVALVPAARVEAWLASAQAAGIDPDSVVPAPLLLAPPASGFVRRELGAVSDYRGPGAAFTLEPALAEALVGDSSVETIDPDRFERELPAILDAPPLDLRQGRFARRRSWRIEGGRARRIALLVVALAVLTLAVQVATILAYTFAADRAEAEAEALAAAGRGTGAGASFGASAAILFDAVRTTPNVELSRLEYSADGTLTATVMMDNPATLAALQGRLEAGGLRVEPGEQRVAGGRPTADLALRPA